MLSLAAALPFAPSLRPRADAFALELSLTSTKAGDVQVYWDKGAGVSERTSSSLPVPANGLARVYRLPIPPGTYRWFRFDPIDNDGTVELFSARIVDGQGRTIRSIDLGDIRPLNQIQSLKGNGERLEIKVVPGGGDPQLLLAFPARLILYQNPFAVMVEVVPRAAIVFGVLAALLFAAGRRGRLRSALGSWVDSLGGRPGWAVAWVSALAVILSAYPVVFGGMSHVALNIEDVRLLYEGTPTLPGYAPGFLADVKGSDVGAILWQHIPFSMTEHRALLRDHEWPLWNRYDSCGTPLLGQGQSLLGDPLHLLVIGANGAAWAWDLDYLAHKWILAAGLGLVVLAVTRRTSAALIVSVAAPFFGFFLLRINHPAYFSFCLAPWPLYCWVRASQAQGRRPVAGWAAGLILANSALMNSGTVKEAYMLLLAMNFSGLCVLLSAERPWACTLRKLAVVSWSLVLLAMISAPVWMTFLETLRESYTSYDAASAFQIQPSLLIGVFDEAFYRPLTPGEHVFAPSANFLILAGVLYFLATLRTQFANRTAMALAASSVVPLALAFGLVPPSWIVEIPFLRNVAHVDNCFSCALIVLWSVIAGAGFSTAASRLRTPEGKADLVISGLLLFALVFGYIAFGQAIHRPSLASEPVFSPLKSGETLPVSLFVGTYLASLLIALTVMSCLVRRWLQTGTLTGGTALGLVLCAWVLLWRQGLQPSSSALVDYVARPGPRPDFHADSPAIDRMRAAQAVEPSRGVGLNGSFFPGWSAAYGLEGISGPDALMNPYYRELTGLSPIERVWDWRLLLTRDTAPAARPFLDFMNVRFYFCTPADGPLGAGLTLRGHDDLDTYESPTAWPRAFFTDRVRVYDNAAELVHLVLAGDGRPFAAVQAKDSADEGLDGIPQDLHGRTVTPADGYALTERTTQFTVHAAGPGVAVLSEAFWPGYGRAEVNGSQASILRLNHAFQGIVLTKAGDYRVRISYQPRGFWTSVAIGASGLLLLGISLYAARRSGEAEPPAGPAGNA